MPRIDLFRQLPKVELHLHVPGSVRPSTMRTLLVEDSLPAALADSYTRAADGEGLTRYLARFAAWNAVAWTPERLARIVTELRADLAADGVVYAELRLRPPSEDDGRWEALMAAAVAAASTGHGPDLRFIDYVNRHWSAERADREARRAVQWADRGLVGFDISGDENIYDAAHLVRAAQLARAGGLAITTHAGEGAGPASVWAALDLFAPVRIAHGVRGAEDPRLVTELRDRGIHLEMALTSNVQTAAVSDLASHPFAALLKAGLSVGLNTDCRTISGTTLSTEYLVAADALGLSLADLIRSTKHAAGAAFLPAAQRQALLDTVHARWA
ncbi:MAG: adenosine deaminase [Chloroflexota bacterium]|nr:adenosine deaminase [Chloroflexota bacterium]